MPETLGRRPRSILTPDQRLRVFVSSALEELAPERAAVARAIRSLRLSPVMFEQGARPYPPRDLYRSYIHQSDIFVGIYHESYGWIAPGMDISGLEDEYILSEGMPHLIYVKGTSLGRDARLDSLLDRIGNSGGLSYRRFATARELEQLVADDLAVLLSERFSDDGPSEAPAPSTPVTASTFIGRRGELDHLLGLIRDPSVRLITLSGPGGVGKTRLALEASRRMRSEFPDGAVVVWLDGLKDPDLVLQAIAADLQVRDRTGRTLLAALGDRLSGKRMLIILDNFEHVMDAAPQVNDLISLATGSKFLVTSRELLRVRGEHVLQLDPFPLPAPDENDLDRLSGIDAIRFFVDRARSASPSFSLSAETGEAVREIVTRLDGLPLALELAAARLRLLSPQALLDLLSSSLDLPGGKIRDLPARQRTMRGAVAWSYDLLEEAERIALERFSVFAGTASLDAAQSVLDPEDDSGSLEMLASLVDKSLIQQVDEEGEPRFRMVVAIREYAWEKLRDRGTDNEARDAHAGFFCELALESGRRMHSPEQARRLALFEREHDNLQAALEWFLSQRRAEEGLELCNRMRWFWVLRGHISIGDHWLRRFLKLDGASIRTRGAALVSGGMMALDLGDLARAEALFDEGIELALAAGDMDEAAWGQTGLGAVRRTLGDLSEAERLQHLALEHFRSSGVLIGQCTASTRLAELALAEGDYEQAKERLEESLAVRRKTRDPWGTGYVLAELGALRLVENDRIKAEIFLREALEAMESVGNVDGIARSTDLLGHVAAGRGDWAEALELFRRAHSLYRGMGHRTGIASTLTHLARGYSELGDKERAVEHAFEAFALADKLGHPRSLAGALEAIAGLLGAEGKATEAAMLFAASHEIRRRNKVRIFPDAFGEGGSDGKVSLSLGVEELERATSAGRAASIEELRRAVTGARAELGADKRGSRSEV